MICIIIPTYNEKENIFKLINEIRAIISEAKIIVVDDSKEKLHKISEINNVSYIYRGSKLGRGSAVLDGMSEAIKDKRIEIFIEMDADFSHDPKELVRNIDFFKKNKLNFLIASRYINNSKIINWPISRHLLSKVSNILARLLLAVPIKDYTNGFRFYDKLAAEHILKSCKNSRSTGFIMLSEIVIELYTNKFKILEISTVFLNRTRGESKVNFFELFKSLIGLLNLFVKKRILKK